MLHHGYPLQTWVTVAMGVIGGIAALIVLIALVMWIKYRIDNRAK